MSLLLLATLASSANQLKNKQHNFTLYCMLWRPGPSYLLEITSTPRIVQNPERFLFYAKHGNMGPCPTRLKRKSYRGSVSHSAVNVLVGWVQPSSPGGCSRWALGIVVTRVWRVGSVALGDGPLYPMVRSAKWGPLGCRALTYFPLPHLGNGAQLLRVTYFPPPQVFSISLIGLVHLTALWCRLVEISGKYHPPPFLRASWPEVLGPGCHTPPPLDEASGCF